MMAVLPQSPRPAAPGEDPARVVNEFWDAFEALFSRYNARLEAAGEAPLTRKELAEKIDISDRTLSDWRGKRILPPSSSSLVEAAVFLGGRREDWRARWRTARDAHERLLADRQARRKPGSQADPGPAPQAGPPPASHDGAAANGGPAAGRARSGRSGAGRPVRPRSQPGRTFAALAVAIVIAATTTVIMLETSHTGHPPATSPTDPGTPSQAASAAPHPALCTYVTREPAWIFTAPSLAAPKLRSRTKPPGSGITILSGPHPPGWTPVLTPRDLTKRNWMQTSVLSTPYHGESPCRDRT